MLAAVPIDKPVDAIVRNQTKVSEREFELISYGRIRVLATGGLRLCGPSCLLVR